ncbi:uncharacterized protein LOC123565825 [Mercenaria mercenaria]|uniref:uncharacterized protein LOC123565825 n=1 Tax=Mercenaria mercenaria TaxID=6596 RepID=UPI00234F3251|nr:uncharacterized protein LOC123565825 [Mercenaria mercenaria]XP_045215540.2 uncharacterized protein LOC123565825 [Mercenaria mercenaria]XP_045215542.2 uncharacterized protein LOC123565825 [Mercenaria mercenaria]
MADTSDSGARKSKSCTPITGNSSTISNGTPCRGGMIHLVHRVDRDLTPNTPRADASFRNEDKVSPMLAKLRMTPGRLLKEKQTILVKKHEETRRKVDSLNVGGGVSMWPEMDSMRMSREEIYRLSGFCLLLVSIVAAVFALLHGSTISLLIQFHKRLSQFSSQHALVVHSGQVKLDRSLVDWHTNYKQIMDSIHEEFDVTKLPTTYILYILVYIATLCVLLYYLIDNMFAKSKLSPKRIKRWVSLLVLTTAWTSLLGFTLVIALRTEAAIETNIYQLSNTQADLILTDLSSDKFNQVLQYWRTRCLPPTTHGTISIFGILPVRDVTFYIQYYSIPIVTVLIAPVFRLIVSLMTIYNVRKDKMS